MEHIKPINRPLDLALVISIYSGSKGVSVHKSVQARVHNKRREGEYSTLTIPCTNAPCKVGDINHQILLFCITTSRVTKDSMVLTAV